MRVPAVLGAVRAVAVVLTLLGVGCSDGPTPPSSGLSQPPPSPPPPVTYTISGIVVDAGVPIAGARVSAWVQTPTAGWPHTGYVTDRDGRFRLSNLIVGARVRPLVNKDGYVQQCAAAPLVVQGDVEIELEVVSRANLAASVGSAPGFRSVSGTIVEMTSSGKLPVAGAFVDYEPQDDMAAAYTYSDSGGRFGLCGLPNDEDVWIGAWQERRFVYTKVAPGQTSVEITLP